MTPEQCRATYRRMMTLRGEPLLIRRYTGTGANRPRFDAEVLACDDREFKPEPLVGTTQQAERNIIVLHEDLVRAQFPVPVKKGDKIVSRGKEWNVEAPDDNKRRVHGELIAWELKVSG